MSPPAGRSTPYVRQAATRSGRLRADDGSQENSPTATAWSTTASIPLRDRRGLIIAQPAGNQQK
jgi:hypothetical protein